MLPVPFKVLLTSDVIDADFFVSVAPVALNVTILAGKLTDDVAPLDNLLSDT